MKKNPRSRVRILRHKIARLMGAIAIAHRMAKRQFAKARHAAEARDKAKKQGRAEDARKAERRRLFHNHKGGAWIRRKHWIQGKVNYLHPLEQQAEKDLEKWVKDHKDQNIGEAPPGLTTIDGHQIAKWIGEIVTAAKQAGINIWIISGWRSPAYSESLCYARCGAPSCSGTCAGRGSNHSCPPTATCKQYEGAVDLGGDVAGFEHFCYVHGYPLHNHLPYDHPHHSYSGY